MPGRGRAEIRCSAAGARRRRRLALVGQLVAVDRPPRARLGRRLGRRRLSAEKLAMRQRLHATARRRARSASSAVVMRRRLRSASARAAAASSTTSIAPSAARPALAARRASRRRRAGRSACASPRSDARRRRAARLVQQVAERRGRAVVERAPDHDAQLLGARQRDVEQPQLLGQLSALAARLVSSAASASRDRASADRRRRSWKRGARASSVAADVPSHRNGQKTTGYSSPLLRWMVVSLSACSSLSRRICADSAA